MGMKKHVGHHATGAHRKRRRIRTLLIGALVGVVLVAMATILTITALKLGGPALAVVVLIALGGAVATVYLYITGWTLEDLVTTPWLKWKHLVTKIRAWKTARRPSALGFIISHRRGRRPPAAGEEDNLFKPQIGGLLSLLQDMQEEEEEVDDR
jgi:hypothetical protein